MSPLDALSAMTSGGTGAITLPVTTTTPTVQGSPIAEGFQHMLDASPVSVTAPTAPISSADGPSTWGHMAQQMIMDVNAQQQTAAQKVSDVLRGGPTPVHEAMIATQEAGLSFTFLSEVRNKVVDAYQQVMQMQV
jgi:flagellar hook-basal body complex protein FliE